MKFSFLLTIKRFSVPLLLLAVTLLAYGWQLHRLGFYWDDWIFLYRYRTLGLGHTAFYGATRQLGALAQIPGFLLAGDSPLGWHIYMLILRWLVAWALAWMLGLLWPRRHTAIVLMALLFAVHPGFTQNSIAVVYSIQFFGLGIYILSLGFMILSMQDSRRFGLYTALTLLTQAFHLLIGEYYFGLELIRPLVLWIALNGQDTRLRKTLLASLPYLALLGLYLTWRLGIFGAGFQTYDYKTVTSAYAKDGFSVIIDLIRFALQDVLYLLVNIWQTTLKPDLIDFSQPYTLFSLLVAFAVAVTLFLILPRLLPDEQLSTPENDHFLAHSLLLGSLATLTGFLPGWFVLRFIAQPGNFGDRFAIPSLLGVSILLIALIEYISNVTARRNLLIAALFIGLAVGLQMRVTNDYRWDWERQLDVYWQTYWRAPALQPGTVLVGNGAISTTAAVNYTGAFAFNFVYATPPNYLTPQLWYVSYYRTQIPANLDEFKNGNFVHKGIFDDIEVPVNRENTLTLYYDTTQCLRVLSPDSPELYTVTADYQPTASFSNLTRIQPQALAAPPAQIFGPEPRQSWCYFYEKADLARQQGAWATVISLKQQADEAGLEPLSPFELFPFVEAYLRTGETSKAEELTLQAYKAAHKTANGLCQLWSRSGQPAPGELGCQ